MTASAMRPEEVPAELADLGGDGLYVHLSQRHPGPPERPMPPGYIARARAVLAAVLPEHEKQVREQQRRELEAEKAVEAQDVDYIDDIATIQDSLGLGTYSEDLFVRFLTLVRDDPKRAQGVARTSLASRENAPGGEL